MCLRSGYRSHCRAAAHRIDEGRTVAVFVVLRFWPTKARASAAVPLVHSNLTSDWPTLRPGQSLRDWQVYASLRMRFAHSRPSW